MFEMGYEFDYHILIRCEKFRLEIVIKKAFILLFKGIY